MLVEAFDILLITNADLINRKLDVSLYSISKNQLHAIFRF